MLKGQNEIESMSLELRFKDNNHIMLMVFVLHYRLCRTAFFIFSFFFFPLLLRLRSFFLPFPVVAGLKKEMTVTISEPLSVLLQTRKLSFFISKFLY